MTQICVSRLTITGSENGLSPDRRQAIIRTNAGLLLIGPLGTNLSQILIEILTFSFKKMHLWVSSAKRRPFCRGLNVLIPVMICRLCWAITSCQWCIVKLTFRNKVQWHFDKKTTNQRSILGCFQCKDVIFPVYRGWSRLWCLERVKLILTELTYSCKIWPAANRRYYHHIKFQISNICIQDYG